MGSGTTLITAATRTRKTTQNGLSSRKRRSRANQKLTDVSLYHFPRSTIFFIQLTLCEGGIELVSPILDFQHHLWNQHMDAVWWVLQEKFDTSTNNTMQHSCAYLPRPRTVDTGPHQTGGQSCFIFRTVCGHNFAFRTTLHYMGTQQS